MKKHYLWIALILLSTTSCDKDDSTPSENLPDAITFMQQGLYPEGFAFDATSNRFLVSSITQGDVFQVDLNGNIDRFIADTNLISSTGITIDQRRNRVIVCSGDVQASSRSSSASAFITASVGIYDLLTGTPIQFIKLADLRPNSGHFASDAAVDAAGNIYVTDSFGPFIYKISADNEKSVFLESTPAFSPLPNAFGLNGIVYHPDGFLLVAKTDEGALFRIPLNNPASFEKVNAMLFPGIDGMALDGKNTLILAVNTGNKVIKIGTTDGWQTARLLDEAGTPDVFPTMVSSTGSQFYVLHSYLNKLLSGQFDQATYVLDKLNF